MSEEVILEKPVPKPRHSKFPKLSTSSGYGSDNVPEICNVVDDVSDDSLKSHVSQNGRIQYDAVCIEEESVTICDQETENSVENENASDGDAKLSPVFRNGHAKSPKSRHSDLMWFNSGVPAPFNGVDSSILDFSFLDEEQTFIKDEHDSVVDVNIFGSDDSCRKMYPDLSDMYSECSFEYFAGDSSCPRPATLNIADDNLSTLEAGKLRFNNNCDDGEEKLAKLALDNGSEKMCNDQTPSKDSISPSLPLYPPILTKIARSPVSVPHSGLSAPEASNVCYVGWLTVFKSNNLRKNEYIRRWCVLHEGKLVFFVNEVDEKVLDTIECKSMIFVSSKSTESAAPNDHLFSFDLYYSTNKGDNKCEHLQLLADSNEERQVWVTFLARCLISGEAAEMCQKVDRAGSVFLKKGTTAEWENGWMIMIKSTLLYSGENDQCSYEIDVRKVIRLKSVDDNEYRRMSRAASCSTAFVIATEGSSLYVQTRSNVVTDAWNAAIRNLLTQRTSIISEQRLTFDDVPIIVEKCINFIAVHGITVEGIHRLSGAAGKVKQLYDEFLKDPHSVHLKMDDYCVHDVASVLRKFLRQLREPLITSSLRSKFIDASCVQEAGTRHIQCKSLLKKLPLVNYKTLRRILAHLKCVADNCDTNMMSVQNLAAIFGPTLFTVDRDDIDGINFTSTSQAIMLTADMILYFNWLFDVEDAEVAKENIIQRAARDLTQHQPKKKLAGELLFSIYTDHREGACFNMQITKKLVAADVCEFAQSRQKVTAQPDDEIGLFEVVCRGELERLIAPDENVLDVVSRWTTWSLDERAHNYLILKNDYVTSHVKNMAFGQTLYPTCEVQFNDNKSFKRCAFKYAQGIIVHLKDTKSTKTVNEWNCEELLWYFGCESKRQPPTKHCLTFIPKNEVIKRTKSNPFFGKTMCFKSEKDLYKWLCTVLLINVNIPF